MPADLGEARKTASKQVDVLRKIMNDARADLSVDEYQCNRAELAPGRPGMSEPQNAENPASAPAKDGAERVGL